LSCKDVPLVNKQRINVTDYQGIIEQIHKWNQEDSNQQIYAFSLMQKLFYELRFSDQQYVQQWIEEAATQVGSKLGMEAALPQYMELVVASIHSMSDLEDVLCTIATGGGLGMVGSRALKPLVQRKLEELDLQPEDVAMVSTAIEKLITEDNKKKLQAVFASAMPLVQGPVTVSKVFMLLEAATGLSKEEVLAMVGRATKPLVQRKLEELGVQPEDVAMVSTAIEKLTTEYQRRSLQAVFAVALPLVQGLVPVPVPVSKVKELLEAATGFPKEEVLGMIGRAAKPLVQRKLEELGVQPEDVTTVSTAIVVQPEC
jgi:hypothetical protein